MEYKKAVEIKGLKNGAALYKGKVSRNLQSDNLGVAGDKILEPKPNFISTPTEKVMQGVVNAQIVFGRDRVGNIATGYGGKGDTQASSIDIVVGRMGYIPREVNNRGETLWADPNFKLDSARIHISQKTDVDDNFGIASGVAGNQKTKSAIGLKADQIRIIARESMKLVTGTDIRNSQGGKVKTVHGIELIAGNDDSDMQPIPKGTNLAECLARLIHHNQKLTSIVDTLLTWQMKMNRQIISHTHISPFQGLSTTPSPGLMKEGPNVMLNHLQATKVGIMNHVTNLEGFKHNYLKPSGKYYINSRFNSTN